MINANELRIGNWVYGSEGMPQQIAYVGDTIGLRNDCYGTDKYQKNPIFSYDIDTINPIPITPELLEKAGFEKLLRAHFWEIDMRHNIGQIQVNPDNGMVWLRHHRHEFSMNPMTTDPIHLHQLQNLYFALTGEELTINL
jgi:hypothetical protein